MVRRFWPLWAAYLAIWTVLMPVAIASQASQRWMAPAFEINQGYVFQAATVMAGILGAIFAVLTAMAVFSFLYSSRSVGAMASLPVRRSGLFWSAYLAGLACLLACHVLTFLLSLAAEAACGLLNPAGLLTWLGGSCMVLVFFYGFATLCAMLTGHILILPAVYFLLNLVVWVVEEMVRYLLGKILYGMVSTACVLTPLSPVVQLLSLTPESVRDGEGVLTGYAFGHWGLLAAYCAAGIGMTLLALALLRRRRMETAGDVVAVAPLKPVFKYCLAGGCALVLASILESILPAYAGGSALSAFLLMLLFLLLGGFVGYFAAEMLMKKTFRVFRASWQGYVVFAAAVLVLAFACERDLFGFERRVPEAAAVERVSLYGVVGYSELCEPENVARTLEIHRRVVEKKDLYERRAAEYDYENYETVRLSLSEWGADGRPLERRYTLYFTEAELSDPAGDYSALMALCNSREAILSRKQLSVPVEEKNIYAAGVSFWDGERDQYLELTAEEAYALYWDCILPDLEEQTLGRVWLVADQDYRDHACQAEIGIELHAAAVNVNGREEVGYTYFHTTPTSWSRRTNAWLAEHGVPLHTVGEYEAWLKTQDAAVERAAGVPRA